MTNLKKRIKDVEAAIGGKIERLVPWYSQTQPKPELKEGDLLIEVIYEDSPILNPDALDYERPGEAPQAPQETVAESPNPQPPQKGEKEYD